VQPSSALASALVVGIYAPDDVREQRLRARSPDLCRDRPEEVRARLAESASAMLPHVHAVIENHGALETAAKADIVRLVAAVRSAVRRP
jgi:ribose 1,5-bisphosphokinase PhnN